MKLAQQLRETNRAEYLLYMWQVENILRAYHCDIELLKEGYLHQFAYDETTMEEVAQWYAELCEMMRTEGIQDKGHLQICKNTLIGLEDLHLQLLSAPNKFPYYNAMYYKALPHLVALRSKSENGNKSELETMFEALYGVMLLRLQRKEVSEDTALAIKDISTLLGQLSDYFKQDKEQPLEFE